jgi:hypothetical protein
VQSDVSAYSAYDDWTPERYEEWDATRRRADLPLADDEPVACFNLCATDNTVIVKLAVPRAGRYVCVST